MQDFVTGAMQEMMAELDFNYYPRRQFHPFARLTGNFRCRRPHRRDFYLCCHQIHPSIISWPN